MTCPDFKYATEAEIREHLIAGHGYKAADLAGHSMAQVHITEVEAERQWDATTAAMTAEPGQSGRLVDAEIRWARRHEH